MANKELGSGIVMRLQVIAEESVDARSQIVADEVVLSDIKAARHETAPAIAILAGGDALGVVGIKSASDIQNAYDMQGRRVKPTQKGIYIVNGKIVVVQ